MQYYLVVVRPFAHYAIGDQISDAQTIASVTGGELASHVVRVAKRGS